MLAFFTRASGEVCNSAKKLESPDGKFFENF